VILISHWDWQKSLGPHARSDLLILFTQKLAAKNLINVEPSKLNPTWRNKRVGEDQVDKRIDRFVACRKIL
jgi:hypothetical protein